MIPSTIDRPFAIPLLRHVVVTLDGEPRGKERPRARNRRLVVPQSMPVYGRPIVYTPKKTRAYEKSLAWAARVSMKGPPIKGPVYVDITAAFSPPKSWSKRKRADAFCQSIKHTSKPDFDNIAKMLDALKGIVFVDDSQICQAAIRKVYSDQPRLKIEIGELLQGRAG